MTQFSDTLNPVSQVDATILAKGINLQHIHSQRYGITLNLIGFLKFSIPFLLVWIPFATTSLRYPTLLGLLIAPAFSTWLHPYLHLPHIEAIKQAPWPMNWLMASRYGRFLWVYHLLHHRNTAINFNLMLLGDFLRGCARIPTDQDKELARQVGGPT